MIKVTVDMDRWYKYKDYMWGGALTTLDDVVEPWQLYLISVKDKRIQKAYENCDIKFTLNFEECYIDCDINCIMTKEDFIKDFALNMRKDTGAIHKTFMHKY